VAGHAVFKTARAPWLACLPQANRAESGGLEPHPSRDKPPSKRSRRPSLFTLPKHRIKTRKAEDSNPIPQTRTHRVADGPSAMLVCLPQRKNRGERRTRTPSLTGHAAFETAQTPWPVHSPNFEPITRKAEESNPAPKRAHRLANEPGAAPDCLPGEKRGAKIKKAGPAHGETG
jgi:hypothetical protein